MSLAQISCLLSVQSPGRGSCRPRRCRSPLVLRRWRPADRCRPPDRPPPGERWRYRRHPRRAGRTVHRDGPPSRGWRSPEAVGRRRHASAGPGAVWVAARPRPPLRRPGGSLVEARWTVGAAETGRWPLQWSDSRPCRPCPSTVGWWRRRTVAGVHRANCRSRCTPVCFHLHQASCHCTGWAKNGC